MMTAIMRDAARDPMADDRKFTASLLTPTDKSNTASRKRNITIPKKNKSILPNLYWFFSAKFGRDCYVAVTKLLRFY